MKKKRFINKFLMGGGVFFMSATYLYAQEKITTNVDKSTNGIQVTTVTQNPSDTTSIQPNKQLDEVVVVGYGTQKSKDLTAPIVTVNAEEIAKHATSNIVAALQGSVAGVQIQNSGQPGSVPTIRIRGITSFGGGNPLFVVDGMFYDNINFLNNGDIETISILKDASASAIYGVRASNGVVLITTKTGKVNRPMRITYEGSIGAQVATNVLPMADATLYSQALYARNTSADSAIINNSVRRFGGSNLYQPLTNTNWYKELLRPAIMTSHNLDVSGGTEKAAYSVGLNYLLQQGIMNTTNDYEKWNLRGQADFKPIKWLKVGFNMILSNYTVNIPNNSAWEQAYQAPPIFPVYDPANTLGTPVRFTDPQSISLAGILGANPVATAFYNNNKLKGIQILPSAYFEVAFLPEKLTWRTAYSQNIAVAEQRNYTPVYYVGSGQQEVTSKLAKEQTLVNNFIMDNTLTYKDKIKEHNFSVLIGNSIRNENFRGLYVTAGNVPNGAEEYLYVNNGNATGRTANDAGTTYNGLSFFGRGTYDYAGKYLATVTFRADGSSKYNEKWGYFPSVGLGWIMSEESWMASQKVISFLKIRGSYGQLGNDRVAASDGFATSTTSINTGGIFGTNTQITGQQIQNYFSYLRWEVVEEFDLGLDLNLFKDKLKLVFDWYYRTTNNAVFTAPIPNVGVSIAGNNGKILNTGIEFAASWSDQLSNGFGYTIGGNITTLTNKVLSINGLDQLIGAVADANIMKVGYAMNSYYVKEVIGVYQNQTEINNDPIAVANNLVPGDFKYKDQNGDGVINGDDRVIVGSYLPSIMYGINLGISYKGFELSILLQGQYGNKIYNRKRVLRSLGPNMNFDQELASNLWTGEGSTNVYPSSAALTKTWNVNRDDVNSFFIQDGSYIRIQNIQAAYTYAPKTKGSKKLPTFRFYAICENPYTFFKYPGFTPDIANGFDLAVYPMTATYTFGVKIIY